MILGDTRYHVYVAPSIPEMSVWKLPRVGLPLAVTAKVCESIDNDIR